MKIYKIAKNYVSCEVWNSTKDGQRSSISFCKPKSGLSRRVRAAVIRDYLRENHGIQWTKFEEQSSTKPNEGQG